MTNGGTEPVREWLKELDAVVRREIGSDIEKVQWRWPVGPPLVDGLGQGLYEVRTKVHRNAFRVFFCIEEGVVWLLHAIVKKSRTAPRADIALARKRKKEVEEARS